MDITDRKQAEERLDTEYRLRDAGNTLRLHVASMDYSANIIKVAQAIKTQLEDVRVHHDSCSIQIVNAEGTDFISIGMEYAFHPENNDHWQKIIGPTWGDLSPNPQKYPWVLEVWKSGIPRYDPCLSGVDLPAKSLIDVAFSQGTLAINSTESQAFTDRDIEILQYFAGVLSEGFQRFRDIIERQRIDKALKEQQVLSIRSDRLRSLGEMAAGIAHELNQPLSGVRGQAEHLVIGMDEGWDFGEEEVRDRLRSIIDQADRMAHIIEHVRIFAREAGNPEVYSVQVNDVVMSAQGMLGEQFRSRGLELICELAEDLPLVSANPFSLEEVILNILINARDALEEAQDAGTLPASPRVLIRTGIETGEGGRRVKIEVIDRGAGIPEDVLPRVFDPFFTTKSLERGTGLGLAVSRSIVEGIGGAINIESTPGEGTTTTVFLPVESRDE